MRPPGGWDTGCTSARVELRITFRDQGAFVLHHLAFLDLQGLSPGSGANPVLLAVPAAPRNRLHGGAITQSWPPEAGLGCRTIVATEPVKPRFFHNFRGGGGSLFRD